MSRRKPRELKILEGSDQPSRRFNCVEMERVGDGVDPPSWMDDQFALEEWHRLVPLLQAQKTLRKAHLSMLAMLCQQHGLIVKKLKGRETLSAAEWSQYRLYCSEFALTPTSMARVPGEADVPADNPYLIHSRRHFTKGQNDLDG